MAIQRSGAAAPRWWKHQVRGDPQGLQVDIGLEEAVEHHQAVGPGGREAAGQLGSELKNGPIFTARGIVIDLRTSVTRSK